MSHRRRPASSRPSAGRPPSSTASRRRRLVDGPRRRRPRAGHHEVPVTATLPAGLTLWSPPARRPCSVTVTERVPASPSPSPSPSPVGRLTDGPPVRHRWHPRRRERRPQADDGLRARPRGRAPARRSRRRASSSARTRGAPATCSSRPSPPGRAASASDVQVVGVVPTPALAFLARHGPFAGGIMVSASHNPADDNGLKVLDARASSSTTRSRTSSSS